jgi:hypothetical protein
MIKVAATRRKTCCALRSSALQDDPSVKSGDDGHGEESRGRGRSIETAEFRRAFETGKSSHWLYFSTAAISARMPKTTKFFFTLATLNWP